jgi:hypothetical protein
MMEKKDWILQFLVQVKKKITREQNCFILWQLFFFLFFICTLLPFVCQHWKWYFVGIWFLLFSVWATFYKIRYSIDMRTVAKLLDKKYNLKERVVSSYDLCLSDKLCPYQTLIWEDTAMQLSLVDVGSFPKLFSFPTKTLCALVCFSTLAFFVLFSLKKEDPVFSQNKEKAVALGIADIAQDVQKSGNEELAKELMAVSREWSSFSALQKKNKILEIKNKMEKLASQSQSVRFSLPKNDLQSEKQSFQPEKQPNLESLAQKLVSFSPEEQAKWIQKLTESLDPIVEKKLIEAMDSKNYKKIHDELADVAEQNQTNANALKKGWMGIKNLAQQAGIVEESMDMEWLDDKFDDDILQKNAGTPHLQIHTSPALQIQSFRALLNLEQRENLLKKPWWPSQYHSSVKNYMGSKE